MTPAPHGRGRVVESHDIARAAFASSLVFAVVAGAWSVYTLVVGGGWWGPLHAFLAGTTLLAISGASQMFTITWSSTVPPVRTAVVVQRRLLIGGVGAILTGVALEVPALVWMGGAAMVGGVVLLASMIHAAVRKSLLRRFDLSARFYLAGIASGAVGITLGTLMGAGVVVGAYPTVRLVHAHLNLVGFVGLTIIGTIPTLLPTTAHSRMVTGGEAVVAWRIAWVGTAAILVGLWAPWAVGAGAIGIAVSGMLLLAGILRRLWGRGRHNLPFLQITLGTMWLIGWTLGDGWRVATTATMSPYSGWTAAVALAGVGQVLAGALGYLVPVLRGSPFPANRRLLEERAWLPLTVLNGAGLCLGADAALAAVVLSAVWLTDFGIRLTRVIAGRAPDVLA